MMDIDEVDGFVLVTGLRLRSALDIGFVLVTGVRLRSALDIGFVLVTGLLPKATRCERLRSALDIGGAIALLDAESARILEGIGGLL
jgi:hypothetical protein